MENEAEETWEAGEGGGWRCTPMSALPSASAAGELGSLVDRAFMVRQRKPWHGATILGARGTKHMLDFTALWYTGETEVLGEDVDHGRAEVHV